jgi:hypothetical protein
MEIIHVDVCSPWCEVECGVFSISSMTQIDVWYIYLKRKKYETIEIVQLMTRVNSTNVLDEGLRIGGVGHRMNLKVKSVKQGVCQK